MLLLILKHFMHPNVVPNLKTCRKRKSKSKKRQWFPPQDCPQLVQVTIKKKQWFPPQEGAEVNDDMEDVHEKVNHRVQILFYAYNTLCNTIPFHEKVPNQAEMQQEMDEVQQEVDHQVDQVQQEVDQELQPMSTPKKIVKCAVRKLTLKKSI
jgi:hypothetical protein